MYYNGEKLVWSEKFQSYGIFRPWRKHPKTEQILWARNYGKRAWFIPVSELSNE